MNRPVSPWIFAVLLTGMGWACATSPETNDAVDDDASSATSSSGQGGAGGNPSAAGSTNSASSTSASSSASSGTTASTSSNSSTATSSASSGGSGGSPSLTPGDLVISEIMNNPSAVGDTNGEWFELYNPTSNAINLKGLVIRHQDPMKDPAAVHTISSNVYAPPKGYVTLGINADPTTNGGVTISYAYPKQVNLNNSSDHLGIETGDQNPVVIDETTYDETSGLDPSGKSRTLNPLFLSASSNDDDTNFCEAASTIPSSTDLGTPGGPNDPCN